MSVTIATHNGSTVHQAHNRRDARCVAKEKHIDPYGVHENWIDEPARTAYHRIFDDAVKAYNARQTDPRRKMGSYYDHVVMHTKRHPAYELIVGVYGDLPYDTRESILQTYIQGWKKRNPSMELIGAYYHADEQGEPHLHLDYVPIGTGYTRGMSKQVSLNKALEAQNFHTIGKNTAQIQWQKAENACLEAICKEFGYIVDHPQIGAKSKHIKTEHYKQMEREVSEYREPPIKVKRHLMTQTPYVELSLNAYAVLTTRSKFLDQADDEIIKRDALIEQLRTERDRNAEKALKYDLYTKAYEEEIAEYRAYFKELNKNKDLSDDYDLAI